MVGGDCFERQDWSDCGFVVGRGGDGVFGDDGVGGGGEVV